MIRWLWLTLLVILLDQGSKQLAEAMLLFNQPVNVLPFFDLTLLYNEGAAFSFLSEQSGWQRWFFIGLALVVSLVLTAWLARLKPDERWTGAALGLIIGGALGNAIDRILIGKVIDFADFHYPSTECLPGFFFMSGACHWPAFNIADSAILVGVAFMLFDALVLNRKRG